MGFRFRKRFKIIHGIWFNLSKSGVSTSIGGKGLTVNLKDGKTKTTAGIPGTGLSYNETFTGTPDDQASERHTILAWVIYPKVRSPFSHREAIIYCRNFSWHCTQ